MGDVIPLFIKSVKVAVYTIKNSSGKAKKGMFALVAVIAMLASLSFTGTRLAYKVKYSGNIIATVSDKHQFDEALSLVAGMVEGNNVDDVVDKPTFNTAIVLNDSIDNTAQVADAIIDNTDAIVRTIVLSVDGCVVAKAEKHIMTCIINSRLDKFNIDGAECTSRFTNDVSYQEGYFMSSELDKRCDVEDIVNALEVVTEARQITEVTVPYKSTVEKTNEQVIGYERVSVNGVSGVNRLTQDIVMVNGEVKSTVDVNTEVLVAPVDEVVVKGTARTQASAKQKQEAHAAGFIFPVPDGTWRVSSYWGDGRNHKGIDICANSGTSIFAVEDGKVVHAGWKGDYGYCVILEHASGIRTLYAHARKICCSVGDTVSQGDVIALVGTTGQSTGNHVHFEVMVNGRRIDPAPYIHLD